MGRKPRPAVVDCGVALLFLAVAGWVGHELWPDPATRVLALNPGDQTLIEWFLAVDTQVLRGEQGLVTDRLNAPDGVNLLANASSLTLGFLLAPVTLTLGAPVSFAVLTIGNLAGTAVAWYLLFARTLGAHRVAAAIGGGFCGFAPAMVSQSNSHWHLTAQWLVPAIVWSVVRLARAAETAAHGNDLPGQQGRTTPAQPAYTAALSAAGWRVVTSGLWLGGLVVVQFFLGAEVLYLAAVTLALLTITYGLVRREWARRVLPGFLAGLAIAAGAATMLLAYPLWLQLAGPGSVPNGPFPASYFSVDLASWPALSPLTVAGSAEAAHLATGPAEHNTFLGAPLLLVAVGCVVWCWREPLVRAAAVAAGVMALLSLGPQLVVNRTRTSVSLPYQLLVDAPVVDAALPQRYALAVVPLLATVLVLALERARAVSARRTGWSSVRPAGPGRGHAGAARAVVPIAVGLALLPLVPTPLPAQDRPPVPAFIRDGHWRDCVDPGGVLVPVPLPTPRDPEPMRWAAATGAAFGLPEGFFIGPYASGGRASMGTAPRPTSRLLAGVAATGEVAVVGPGERARAAADLAYWGAGCVVLRPDQRYARELRAVLVELLGPGEPVAGVWAWRV